MRAHRSISYHISAVCGKCRRQPEPQSIISQVDSIRLHFRAECVKVGGICGGAVCVFRAVAAFGAVGMASDNGVSAASIRRTTTAPAASNALVVRKTREKSHITRQPLRQLLRMPYVAEAFIYLAV